MINEELVQELLRRKKKSSKMEELQKHKELILQLRKSGLSLQDICFYLRKELGIKVSTSTLREAIPELENRLGKAIKIVKKMTNEELKMLWNELKAELAKRGLIKQ